MQAAKTQLDGLEAADAARQETARAKNDLEAFILAMQVASLPLNPLSGPTRPAAARAARARPCTKVWGLQCQMPGLGCQCAAGAALCCWGHGPQGCPAPHLLLNHPVAVTSHGQQAKAAVIRGCCRRSPSR